MDDQKRYARLWLTYPVQMRDRLYALARELDLPIVKLCVLCVAIGLRDLESRVYHDLPSLPPDDPSLADG